MSLSDWFVYANKQRSFRMGKYCLIDDIHNIGSDFVKKIQGDEEKIKKLNVGCGTDIKFGWRNLDCHGRNGADIIADLNNLPTMLMSEDYDIVLLDHVLEHFSDTYAIMKELTRITKWGGKIIIRVPNETYEADAFCHKRRFTPNTFKSLVDRNNFYDSGDDRLPLEIKSLKYYARVSGDINFVGKIWLNLSAYILNFFSLEIATHTILKYLFPMVCIEVEFEKRW